MENYKLQRVIQKWLAFSFGLIDGGYACEEFPEDDPKILHYKIIHEYRPLTLANFWILIPEKGVAEKYCFKLYELNSGNDYGIYGVNLAAILALDGTPKFSLKNEELDLEQVSFWSDEFSSWLNKSVIEDRERLRAEQDGTA